MENISVISYNAQPCKITTQSHGDKSVLYIQSPKSRRRLRKYLKGNDIGGAVISGEVPGFVYDVLRKCEIKIYTGEGFMHAVYPKLIARAAKMNKGCDFCTVYDDGTEEELLEIIKCAAKHFRHVSLCTTSENTKELAEAVMDATGLALGFGEGDGVGIVCGGRGGRQKIKVDLTALSKTLFSDSGKAIISPPLAEALAGDRIDEGVMDRLKLKIHSLC